MTKDIVQDAIEKVNESREAHNNDYTINIYLDKNAVAIWWKWQVYVTIRNPGIHSGTSSRNFRNLIDANQFFNTIMRKYKLVEKEKDFISKREEEE